MDIRPLDAHDDSHLRRFHQITWRAEKEDGRPWNPMWSLDEMAGLLRVPTDDQRIEGLAAWDGDEMVGAGFMMLPLLANTDKAFCFVCVEPELRGRGIGRQVLDALVHRARADGRTTLTSNAGIPFEQREDHPILQWAARHGFSVANTEIMRTLRLPLDLAALAEVEAESAPHHAGYEVRAYAGALPDELLDSYCVLDNQLIVDAPSGELDYEEEATTPEIVRQRETLNKEMGRSTLSAVALRDGEVVAYTDLVVNREGDEAHQWGTFVHREHRGHRLGLAVKAANLRQLQRLHPQLPRLITTNAETNAWMVAINERLGFAPEAVVPELKRDL